MADWKTAEVDNFRRNAQGFTVFYVCQVCGAVVFEENRVLHVEWHERLRRSVDEGELLD